MYIFISDFLVKKSSFLVCKYGLFFTRALADTRQIGKLSKDQFALAMYLIQQKVSKGIDPPQVLSPDMIPPTERNTPIQVSNGLFVDTQSLCALIEVVHEY